MTSDAPSPVPTLSEELGLTLTDLLLRIYQEPKYIQGNFCREYDTLIAMAASKGLITTNNGSGNYGRIWRITRAGMAELHMEGYQV